MNKAINNITIAKAVDEGYLDEDFFEDTDDPDELVKRVTIYHRVSIPEPSEHPHRALHPELVL